MTHSTNELAPTSKFFIHSLIRIGKKYTTFKHFQKLTVPPTGSIDIFCPLLKEMLEDTVLTGVSSRSLSDMRKTKKKS